MIRNFSTLTNSGEAMMPVSVNLTARVPLRLFDESATVDME
jgi:hypothetical protein